MGVSTSKFFKFLLRLQTFCIFTGIPFLSLAVYSQDEIYIPLEFQAAYDKETRSPDGRPGPRYWQNRAEYYIRFKINPDTKSIDGHEKVIYYNNSPDSLNRLVVRLYQDLYKRGNLRDLQVDPADIHEGVAIKYLSIDDSVYAMSTEDLATQKTGTLLIILLHHPLPPESKLHMDIKWENKIPEKTRRKRMGAEGDSALFVAYCHPEIAVYDDVDGWDLHSHSGSQEFYRDFNDYDVEIAVPQAFLVWATGVLQNPEEVYTDHILEKYQSAFHSDEVIKIVSAEDYPKGSLTRAKVMHSWKFRAVNVSDFAFAASKVHLWDATSLVVDEHKQDRVLVEAVYKKEARQLYELADIAKETIAYLSAEWPGIPFPYPKFTVYNSNIAGGMEFPMMANDGITRTRSRTIGLTSHEITHTYFPFYTGTNETKYAWMDEGMVVMLDLDFQRRMTDGYDRLVREVYTYEQWTGRELDLPLMTPSSMLRDKSLRIASYSKPAIALVILKDMLGDALFKNALQTFMHLWQGKHPSPFDFFFTFNEVTGENLNWFWNRWFFSRGYTDLSIKAVESLDGGSQILIENIGTLPVPIYLKIQFEDGKEKLIEQKASVWKDNAEIYKVLIDSRQRVQKLELGSKYIPDRNKENNIYNADRVD